MESTNLMLTCNKEENKHEENSSMCMVMMEGKRLQARLKIKKKHVMVMFVCMNGVNTSVIQRMNDLFQPNIPPSISLSDMYQK